MVHAALSGTLQQVPTTKDPIFGLEVPQTCPGVPPEVLQPRSTWQDPQAYDAQARKVAGMFVENFKKFSGDVPQEVRTACAHAGA